MSTSNVEINDLISHTNALHFTDPSLPILGVPLDSLSQPPSFILVAKAYLHQTYLHLSRKAYLHQSLSPSKLGSS
jgi:hypothetical protein